MHHLLKEFSQSAIAFHTTEQKQNTAALSSLSIDAVFSRLRCVYCYIAAVNTITQCDQQMCGDSVGRHCRKERNIRVSTWDWASCQADWLEQRQSPFMKRN